MEKLLLILNNSRLSLPTSFHPQCVLIFVCHYEKFCVRSSRLFIRNETKTQESTRAQFWVLSKYSPSIIIVIIVSIILNWAVFKNNLNFGWWVGVCRVNWQLHRRIKKWVWESGENENSEKLKTVENAS